jgi:hypothetical protein
MKYKCLFVATAQLYLQLGLYNMVNYKHIEFLRVSTFCIRSGRTSEFVNCWC